MPFRFRSDPAKKGCREGTALTHLPVPTKMLVLTSLSTALHLPPAELRRHAVELRDRGFTVLPKTGIDGSLVEAARTACSGEFAGLQNGVAQLGMDPSGKYAFSEIVTRHRLRWSFRPQGPSAWTELLDQAVKAASPVIEETHTLPPHPDDHFSPAVAGITRQLVPSRPTIDHVDAIVSKPGAAAQRFHADSGVAHHRMARLCPRHRLFNVFVPLVDLEEDGDGTMLWPGSHLERTRYSRYHAAIERSGSLEGDARAMGEMEVPACPAGGLLLFDFRLLHRGMPNTSGRERALAHAVLATGHASDRMNYPEASLRAVLDALPRDGPAREALVRSVAAQQEGAWAAVRANSTS